MGSFPIMMKVFPLDLLMGLILSLMLLCILVGSFIFVRRRERGPIFLLISGLIGVFGPILHLLDQVEVVEIDPILVLTPIFVWVVGTLFSILLWRRRE